jgi:tryptophan synthase alpha chain
MLLSPPRKQGSILLDSRLRGNDKIDSNRLILITKEAYRNKQKLLCAYITLGYTNLSVTRKLLLGLARAGVDILELGFPFSDPLADGPVIQAASARALKQGTTLRRVLAMVGAIRPRLRVPVLLLSYWNPLLQFAGSPHRTAGRNGADAHHSLHAFARAAHEQGVAGLIIPDLPLEEHGLWHRAVDGTTLDTVLLATPTSPAARLRAIAHASQGFIYYVSVTGTTGVRQALPPNLIDGIRQLRLLTTKPLCVGFGISTPDQATQVARIADGVIVGSALVREIANSKGRTASIKSAAAFLKRLRQAIR